MSILEKLTNQFHKPNLKYWTDRQTVSYLTLTMTSTQFIEMSVTVTYNSPFQEVSHFDDPKRSSTWFY